MNCPTCGRRITAACGFHAHGNPPTGWQKGSFGTPGEHFIHSHHCEVDGLVHVADVVCGIQAAAETLDDASIQIGAYWR